MENFPSRRKIFKVGQGQNFRLYRHEDVILLVDIGIYTSSFACLHSSKPPPYQLSIYGLVEKSFLVLKFMKVSGNRYTLKFDEIKFFSEFNYTDIPRPSRTKFGIYQIIPTYTGCSTNFLKLKYNRLETFFSIRNCYIIILR